MPAENVLEVHHLKKSVGQGEHELSILTGVNLIVKPAQTLALIGESGSGKSTLLAILAGLDDGSSGEVKLRAMTEDMTRYARLETVFLKQNGQYVPCGVKKGRSYD